MRWSKRIRPFKSLNGDYEDIGNYRLNTTKGLILYDIKSRRRKRIYKENGGSRGMKRKKCKEDDKSIF